MQPISGDTKIHIVVVKDSLGNFLECVRLAQRMVVASVSLTYRVAGTKHWKILVLLSFWCLSWGNE